MLIYLIEDNAIKARKICDFLQKQYGSDASQNTYGGYNTGLRAILDGNPDLVILDMTIPTYDRVPGGREGRIRPLGGYDLMRKLKLKRVNAHVVVVTQLESFGDGDEEVSFSDIDERCKSEFYDIYLGAVYFDQVGNEWQNQLKGVIDELLGSAKC